MVGGDMHLDPLGACGRVIYQDCKQCRDYANRAFLECICRSLDVLQLARSYAEDFVANMNSYAAVTDLWHPDQDIERSESLPPKVPKRNLFLSGDFGSVVPLQ